MHNYKTHFLLTKGKLSPTLRSLFGTRAAAMISLKTMIPGGLTIDRGSVEAFTGRVKAIREKLPLPDFLTAPRTAAYFAGNVSDIFRKSAFAEAGDMESLRDEHFDQLLFAAAAGSYGWDSSPLMNASLLQTPFPLELLPEKSSLVTSFGVEMECFGVKNWKKMNAAIDAYDPSWCLTEDASIEPDDDTEGAEIVSPPMGEHNIHRLIFFANLAAAMGAKATVEGSCALHVHAGIDNIPGMNEVRRMNLIRQLVINYTLIEDDLDLPETSMTKSYGAYINHFSGTARERTESYLNTVLEATEQDLPDNAWNASPLQPQGRRCSRINFLSLKSYGTGEFRQHPGSVDSREIMAWVMFVNGFIALSMDMSKNGAHVPDEGERERLKNLAALFNERRKGRVSGIKDPAIPAYRSIAPTGMW